MPKLVLSVNSRVVVDVEDGTTPEQAYQTLDFNIWSTSDKAEVVEADLDGFIVEE